MTRSVRRSVARLVRQLDGRSVCHNSLKDREAIGLVISYFVFHRSKNVCPTFVRDDVSEC